MKATPPPTVGLADAKDDDEGGSQREKDEERSFIRSRGFRMWARFELRRALLRRLTDRNVGVKADAQIEVWTFKCRRKRLERTGSADCRGRGHIERFFARRPINAEALAGETAIAVDAEGNRDDTFVTQVKRFRHHRDPVLFQLGEQPVDVALKIHAVGRCENRDSVARLRAPSSAAPMTTTAATTAGNSAFRSVRAAARGMFDCILHFRLQLFAGRRVI